MGGSTRQRSGRNADGSRSNLGRLVDPLGIFSKGRLVNPDSDDERVLQSASNIINAIRASSMNSDDIDAESVLTTVTRTLQSLTPTEASQISAIVVDRIWTRRQELATLGSKFTQVLFQQTRQRL